MTDLNLLEVASYSLVTDVFFARPYASNESETKEYQYKLIR